MNLSALSSSASVPLDARAAASQPSSSTASLLQSKGSVINDIVVPSVSKEVANGASTDSATQSGFIDGVKKNGDSPGGGQPSSSDTLAELIEAAKRKVQPLVGASGADQVVGKDGGIDYKKLADLISTQEAQGQQTKTPSSSATVLDLVT